jgi:hypothetical protein
MGGACRVQGLLEGKAERGRRKERSKYRMDDAELNLRKMGVKVWRIIILENGCIFWKKILLENARKSLWNENFGKWV